jgi:hypothetical protein
MNLREDSKKISTNSSYFKKGNLSAFKGKHHTEESKRKLSLALSGRHYPKDPRKANSTSFKKGHIVIGGFHIRFKKGQASEFSGRHHSKETRMKLSEGKKGKSLPIEHRKNISEGLKRIIRSEEWKKKCRENLGKGHLGYHHTEEWKRKKSEQQKGKHHTEETKRKLSESLKGHRSWNKGTHGLFSPEALMKRSIAMKANWRNEAYIRNWVKGLNLRPNTKELQLNSILQSLLPNEFRYVGDGQVFIDSLCPDFINCNGKKQVIEFFGEPYHDPANTFKKCIRYRATEKGRIESFAKYGYSTLIIWQHELRQPAVLEQKILKFVGGCN